MRIDFGWWSDPKTIAGAKVIGLSFLILVAYPVFVWAVPNEWTWPAVFAPFILCFIIQIGGLFLSQLRQMFR